MTDLTTLILNLFNVDLAEELLVKNGFSVEKHSRKGNSIEKGSHVIETNATKGDLLNLLNRKEFVFDNDCNIVEVGSIWNKPLFGQEWLTEWELRGSKDGQ